MSYKHRNRTRTDGVLQSTKAPSLTTSRLRPSIEWLIQEISKYAIIYDIHHRNAGWAVAFAVGELNADGTEKTYIHRYYNSIYVCLASEHKRLLKEHKDGGKDKKKAGNRVRPK